MTLGGTEFTGLTRTSMDTPVFVPLVYCAIAAGGYLARRKRPALATA